MSTCPWQPFHNEQQNCLTTQTSSRQQALNLSPNVEYLEHAPRTTCLTFFPLTRLIKRDWNNVPLQIRGSNLKTLQSLIDGRKSSYTMPKRAFRQRVMLSLAMADGRKQNCLNDHLLVMESRDCLGRTCVCAWGLHLLPCSVSGILAALYRRPQGVVIGALDAGFCNEERQSQNLDISIIWYKWNYFQNFNLQLIVSKIFSSVLSLPVCEEVEHTLLYATN